MTLNCEELAHIHPGDSLQEALDLMGPNGEVHIITSESGTYSVTHVEGQHIVGHPESGCPGIRRI